MTAPVEWTEITGRQRLDGLEPNARVYQRNTNGGGHLTVIVGRQPKDGRFHLSISHRANLVDPFRGNPIPDRNPTWEEIRDARYAFIPAEGVDMAMYLPAASEYVNLHPTTFHLHECRCWDGRTATR